LQACLTRKSQHDVLLHVILTLTILHDRYLSAAPTTEHSAAEAFHSHQGTMLLNRKLSQSVPPSERDALWGTAALLGAIAFANIEATTAEEAWPLKAASSQDLCWLKMSEGKKAVWEIANPARPDSVFHALHSEHDEVSSWFYRTKPGLEMLPAEFLKLYDLGPESSSDNNVYYGAAFFLGRIITMEINRYTILHFVSFVYYIHPDHKARLERKDPRTLLLIAYWYAKICQNPPWWMERRARIECQAICIYLEKYHSNEVKLVELLKFPKMMCGLVAKQESKVDLCCSSAVSGKLIKPS